MNEGGLLSPGNSPGVFTVDSYLQTSCHLLLEIGGAGAGQYDILKVLGTADFQGGDITLKDLGGAALKSGTKLDLITAGTLMAYAGLDDAISYEGFGDTSRLKLTFGPHSLSLAVTPVPPAFLLSAPGLGGIWLLRRHGRGGHDPRFAERDVAVPTEQWRAALA